MKRSLKIAVVAAILYAAFVTLDFTFHNGPGSLTHHSLLQSAWTAAACLGVGVTFSLAVGALTYWAMR